MTESTFHTTQCDRCHKIELGRASDLKYYSLTIKPFSSAYGETHTGDICLQCYTVIQKVIMLSGKDTERNRKRKNRREQDLRSEILKTYGTE